MSARLLALALLLAGAGPLAAQWTPVVPAPVIARPLPESVPPLLPVPFPAPAPVPASAPGARGTVLAVYEAPPARGAAAEYVLELDADGPPRRTLYLRGWRKRGEALDLPADGARVEVRFTRARDGGLDLAPGGSITPLDERQSQ